MSSEHLVDPELRPLLGLMEAFKFDDASLSATRRDLLSALAGAAKPLPPEVEKSETFIAGLKNAPNIRLLIYQPSGCSDQRPALLNIHGGGYVTGAPEMQEADNVRLAAKLGLVVVSPDYRLAPETHFPGNIEDCYAALTWMVAEAAALRIDPSRIAISGESAGGGLAAALALLTRDRREVSIAFQRLIYPMIDDRSSSVRQSQFVGEFVWTRDTNAYGWKSLLGEAPGGPDVSPYAAAARADNLSGLPPTFIACGALDFFIGENFDYANRLLCAGVPTEFHVYPGAPHGFDLLPNADVSRRFKMDATSALKRGLGL